MCFSIIYTAKRPENQENNRNQSLDGHEDEHWSKAVCENNLLLCYVNEEADCSDLYSVNEVVEAHAVSHITLKLGEL